MEERFGGYASAVQANTARVQLGIDQRDFQPQIGGEKGGGVASRPSADDCDAHVISFGHYSLSTTKGTKVHEVKHRNPVFLCGPLCPLWFFFHPWTDSKNGCSNASAIQRRKRAASAPSISR